MAGDVGVVTLEVVDHRVDDHLWLLRGVGAVEVDQRTSPRDGALEDGEVLADDLEVGKQAFHGDSSQRVGGLSVS
jgi:hypothetical protein